MRPIIRFKPLSARRAQGMGFDFSGPVDDDKRIACRLTDLADKSDTQFVHNKEKRFALAPPPEHRLYRRHLADPASLPAARPRWRYHSGMPANGAPHVAAPVSHPFQLRGIPPKPAPDFSGWICCLCRTLLCPAEPLVTPESSREADSHPPSSHTTVRTAPYTAVQIMRLSRLIVSSIETNPSPSQIFFGSA